MHQRLPQNGKNYLAQDGATERFTSISGCKMRYLVAGGSLSRPPLLLVHGLIGYSFSWRFNLAALAANRRVYAVDLPGVGFSGRSADLDCSLQATAERLLCFLREQGIGSIDILGTSHGGGVAMMLAALLGREVPRLLRVNKLVLVAPINPWSRHGLLLSSIISSRLGAATFRAIRPWLRASHGMLLARLYGDRRRIPAGTLEGYAAALDVEGTIEHAIKIAHCLRSDLGVLETILPEISELRTLFIWGDRDRAVLPRSAVELKSRFSNAELRIMKGAGHLPYEEFPDEFNGALLRFLDNDGPASSSFNKDHFVR